MTIKPWMAMSVFKKIALIHTNDELAQRYGSVIALAEKIVKRYNCKVVKHRVPPSDSNEIKDALHEAIEGCDLIIIFGGDGTFLGIARKVCDFKIPFLGVNLGRLGFLTDLKESHIEEGLTDILEGRYQVEEREVLHATIEDHFDSYAINDVVIHQRSISRMIELDVFANDRYLTTYQADGVILSTPTGSTAYALSSGGPLIYPTLSALLIAPICPHTFSHRPIVIPTDQVVRVAIKNQRDYSASVSCDGQVESPFKIGERLEIRNHTLKITLLHPPKYDYYDILKAKLNWGTSSHE